MIFTELEYRRDTKFSKVGRHRSVNGMWIGATGWTLDRAGMDELVIRFRAAMNMELTIL